MKQSFQNFWNNVTAVHPSITDTEQRSYSKLLATLLAYLIPVMSFFLVRQLLTAASLESSFSHVVLGVLIATYILNRIGYYQLSANLLIFALGGIILFMGFNNQSAYLLMLMSIVFIMGVLLLSYQSIMILGLCFGAGLVVYTVNHPESTLLTPSFALIYFVVNSVVMIGFTNYRSKIEAERRQELLNMNNALRQSEASLELRVKERTRDLELAMDVSRQITTVLDQSQLLKVIADQTKEAFHLYHVSVFTYNADQRQLTLAAGSGDVGETMRQKGRSFMMDHGSGLVPEAARKRASMLANDVNLNENHTINPLLPMTRSELAVPMIANNTLIGVLDLQADTTNHFKDEGVRIMNMLAEQLAIAVENATLFDEVEKARREQEAVAEKLRAVDNMKSQFLASMSHELRTPLNAILNFTKFVQTGMLGPVNDKQKDALNKTIGSGKHLLALINDVLDITKIESDMLNLFVEEDVSLTDELEAIVATAETLLSEKPEVKFVSDYDEALIPDIICDKRRVRQILLNLVSNACKFTEEGQVTLKVDIEDGLVKIVVTDTGPGIPAEDHELIFEPFRQSHAGMSKGGGTGLGLPIARRLAEAHGGQLVMESVVGQGTTFSVVLPVASSKLLDMIQIGKAS